LSKLPIAVQHLQETGIGKTVNGMRKTEGQVGDEARNLVNKWKAMVAAEDEKSETDNEEEAAAQERDVEPEQEEAANLSYDQEELSRHSKHLKKNKKDDGSRKEHNHSRESPQKEEKSKKKQVDTAVPSTSGKSKSSNKSSHRSQSPPSEKSSKNKHKSSSEKSSKESKKDKESSSKVSGSKKQHHDSDDSTRNQSDEEADSGVISFAQALGGIGSSKKKKSKDKDREKVKERHKQSEERKPSLSELVPQNSLPSSFTSISRHHPTSIDIRSSDYEISPNYKPLPQKYSIDPLPDRNQKKVSVEEALGAALASKGVRYCVYFKCCNTLLNYLLNLGQRYSLEKQQVA
jgi:elongin-A